RHLLTLHITAQYHGGHATRNSMDEFYRIKRLPPYVFAIVNDLKTKARARGEDVIDLGMGNPDLGTPKHIVAKLIEAAQNPKNHRYSASRPLTPDGDFFARLEETAKLAWPKAKLLILSFPHNPTTLCVDRGFFEKVVAFAREHRLMVVHDFAYADFAFDGYRPPSFLEVPGAKEVGVELFSTSKSYNMPGWRLGFVCGNAQMIHALARIKSYLDYGAFQPIQIAGIIALEGDQKCVAEIVEVHRKRRDVLVDGLNKLGWSVPKPKGTMFVWAPIPEPFRALGSLEFAKMLIEEARVAVSPGIGFGEYGEGYVRFALVENEQRIKQALRGLKQLAS